MASAAIVPGITHQQRYKVEEIHLANHLGSGTLSVLATPDLIAWMENTAMLTVAVFLPSTDTTVGTAISMKHLKASHLHAEITCHATVTEIEGRRIHFDIKAFDERQMLIGEGSHERFVVDADRFMQKLIG
jgi:fluoroacetyl-CoA thioesterase